MQKKINIFSFLIIFLFFLAVICASNYVYAAIYNCCYHECNGTEPSKCENNKVMQCQNNCDNDPYKDWCEIQDCTATGQTCQIIANTATCTGTCVPSCTTGPNCRASLTNGHTVSGGCCGAGYCYACDTGYTWSNNVCTANCASTCSTGPGCRNSLTNGSIVAGNCCGNGSCYACNTGYTWSNNACVANCTPACANNGACNDNNSCTNDVCNNPNTCAASCSHAAIADGTVCAGTCRVCSAGSCSVNDNTKCTVGTCTGTAGTCTATIDSTSPTVNTFTAVANVSVVNINYIVADFGSSHLDRIEVWRAADNGSNAPNAATWTEVNTLRQTITAQNLDNYTHAVIDTPGNGTWWYGIHVVDQAGNLCQEANPIKVIVAAAAVCTPNGCNGNCPANCTVAQDPDCDCQTGNTCCGIGCNNASDNDCPVACAPNGCNGNCPVGCTVAQDPDCGCQTGNSCCGIGCTNTFDNECPITCISNCSTSPRCRNSLTNGVMVEGDCCGNGFCYDCAPGYTWNSFACVINSTCVPDSGCNNNCPAGCTVAQDPDCGCQTGNGCCGIGCKKAIDDECAAIVDNIPPTISNFSATAQVNSNTVYIHASALDSGGSFLDRVEVWRAPDSAGAPGSWQKISNLSKTLTVRNLNSYVISVNDSLSNGTWWYGIHVFDQAGNQTNENSPISVVVNGSSACTQSCNTGPGCTNLSSNSSIVAGNCCGAGSCYECNAGYAWIVDNLSNISACAKNCTTNLDCPSSKICCGNGICSTPNCVNNSSCGNSGNNCNPRVCANPNTCGSYCTYAPVTTCQNNDGCCLDGCNHANDNNCPSNPSIKITSLISSSTNKAIFMASEPVVLNSIVTGGTPPFTYSWVGQSGNIGNQANLSMANPGIGTYPITLTIVDANNHSTTTPTFTLVVLYDTFDWSHRLLPSAPPAAGNWMTPIKNQGGCGSCWDFSTMGAVEGQYKIQQNDASSASNLDLSEQYLLGCPGSGGGCGGGWAGGAANFLRSTGTPEEICIPYQAQNITCPTTCTDNSAISYWRIQNHNFVSFSNWNPNIRRREMKEALVKQGPVIASMYISGWNASTFQCAENNLTDHSVVIVGYDDSQGVWIVRNSWGASWNGNGYFKVAYNNCNIEKNTALTIGQVYKN